LDVQSISLKYKEWEEHFAHWTASNPDGTRGKWEFVKYFLEFKATMHSLQGYGIEKLRKKEAIPFAIGVWLKRQENLEREELMRTPNLGGTTKTMSNYQWEFEGGDRQYD